MTLKEAEIAGRTDQVIESVSQANAGPGQDWLDQEPAPGDLGNENHHEAGLARILAEPITEPPAVLEPATPVPAVPPHKVMEVLRTDPIIKLMYDRIMATKGQAAADFWLANNTHNKKP